LTDFFFAAALLADFCVDFFAAVFLVDFFAALRLRARDARAFTRFCASLARVSGDSRRRFFTTFFVTFFSRLRRRLARCRWHTPDGRSRVSDLNAIAVTARGDDSGLVRIVGLDESAS
jgi:hypothetical protein